MDLANILIVVGVSLLSGGGISAFGVISWKGRITEKLDQAQDRLNRYSELQRDYETTRQLEMRALSDRTTTIEADSRAFRAHIEAAPHVLSTQASIKTEVQNIREDMVEVKDDIKHILTDT